MDNYYIFYFLIIGLIMFFYLTSSPKRNQFLIYVIGVFLVFYFGMRNEDIGADTQSYKDVYISYINVSGSLSHYLSSHSDKSFLFTRMIYFIVKAVGYKSFVFLVAVIEVYLFIIAVQQFDKFLFGNYLRCDKVLIVLLYAVSFFFISVNINIILNGLAIFAFMAALGYASNKKYFKAIGLFIIALDFHISILLLFISIVLVYFFQKLSMKYFYILFFIGVLISYLSIDVLALFKVLLNSVSDDRFGGYVNQSDHAYRTGFRADFVIFNCIFLIPCLICESDSVKIITKYFCITSFIFFISSELIYNDRIGLLSWISIPLIVYFSIKDSVKNYKLVYLLAYLGLNLILIFK